MQSDIDRLQNQLLELATPYLDCADSLYEQIYENCVRTEYGRGGIGLYRGYYCPSPIDDIIIGNVTRGRLYKNKPLKISPDYQYHFDAENRLRCVDYADCNKELIIHEDQLELGLGYHVYNSVAEPVDTISMCQYSDHRIEMFVIASYHHAHKSIYDCTVELFSYQDDHLHFVDRIEQFKTSLNQWCTDQHRFLFNYDANGYLSEYVVYKTNLNGIAITDGERYHITRKRLL